ncbi:MAG: cyclic nucleotide-binding domain-containing protein [Proteobacteria bacterium]|nr:cyclic nucleotide-binding domain-containing protein [Pseudomonadota bacterium]MCL2308011.1 cyclic nucleotide-binding domain-containing protein [Pseudomonadota bacterium]
MNDVRFEVLSQSKLATELNPEQCKILASLIEMHDYQEGDVLVRERTSDENLQVVVKGSLGIIKNFGTPDQELLNTITVGNFAGELGFMDNAARYASLVALAPTQTFTLSRTKLETLLDKDPRIVYNVMRAILRVAHQVQYRLSMQQAELTNYLYKQQGRY